MKPKSRASAQKWRKIRRKKSKRCRSSINCKASPPKNRREWRSASRNSPNNSYGDGAKRAGLVRASFPESVDGRVLGWDFHRDWRFRSNYSILFLGRNYGGNSFLQHQFSGALSCRRIEIVDHDSFLVGFGSGNDVDRHYCRRRYLRPRSRLWRTGLKES